MSVLVRSLYWVVEASLNVSLVCLLWRRELSSEEGLAMLPSAPLVCMVVLLELGQRMGLPLLWPSVVLLFLEVVFQPLPLLILTVVVLMVVPSLVVLVLC